MSLIAALTLHGLLVTGDPPELPVITVVSRRPQSAQDLGLAVSALTPGDTEPLAFHPNELLDAGAGTWISRGSGQEHLTAIRSPVLTGAGACGAFLLLEDGIPVRPAGMCNVNNLAELNLERARRVEVLRGPGSALHGSNALHGAIEAVMPDPGRGIEIGLMAGENDYARLDLGLGTDAARLDATVQSAGSFRQEESYDQAKLNLRLDQDWGPVAVSHRLAATRLDQQTAGFILGFESYRDPELRRANLNPEAFRDARALRASSRLDWTRGQWAQRLTPFARHSRMQFRQHFLPGKPLEDNGQDSLGLQWLWHREGELSLDLGMDLEWADIQLTEFQDGPTEGSAFLQATRPPGFHYDYQVQQGLVGAFGQVDWRLNDDWRLLAGLRVEYLEYDYDNRMLDGNTTDTGEPCGFGGCLYTRPADRRDDYTEVSPKLSIQYARGPHIFWARLARGFRPPQATELYRLQRGQTVADLDPERLDSLELGWRGEIGSGRASLVAFHQDKENVIFRDAGGFNVSDGRTEHQGLELEWEQPLGAEWALRVDATLARHRYISADSPTEAIVPGNRVDTAPDHLGRVALDWSPNWGQGRLEWVHLGGYALDAANDHHYGGHDLFHLNLDRPLGGGWTVRARLANVLNARYAERADFAFGNYRYFPGDGRRLSLALNYRAP